ncbi:hypothetical protein NE237_022201 [Protea cynaroides]|uniref:Uncharacterized protein n=1 Tax=Protea cynaroides TaxID=273540 RepID=A0A9Q0HDY5_9MAGN|nr:hypothetical protein NE237_022201 [Protea cynaroides]
MNETRVLELVTVGSQYLSVTAPAQVVRCSAVWAALLNLSHLSLTPLHIIIVFVRLTVRISDHLVLSHLCPSLSSSIITNFRKKIPKKKKIPEKELSSKNPSLFC